MKIKTVLASGAAGVGKTTLSDYIAYQWALFKQGEGQEGLWSTFDVVLIVSDVATYRPKKFKDSLDRC